ncbi:uncharacterized protein LOC144864791 isoform X2 [Branchiostoma floridae x Branchiostoma japonicum]
MSRPGRSTGKWLSDLHDFCRLCGKNQRIRGTLQHVVVIFDDRIKKGDIKKGDPPVVTLPSVATVLLSLGLKISKDDPSKSRRVCETCARRADNIKKSMDEYLETWKQNETSGSGKQTPTSAKGAEKRCRETPSKTPRDSKKRLIRTPLKSTLTATREQAEPQDTVRVQEKDKENRTLANAPDRKSETKVTVTYSSLVRNYSCDNSLAGVVENLAKGNLATSAKLMMTHPKLSSEIQKQIELKVEKEASTLLSTGKLGPSILRKTSPKDLETFSYDEMEQELKSRAPTIHSVLSTVGNQKTIHTCVAASIIIRAKDNKMSALAYVINCILQHGGVKRSVFDRLCKMGITTSHKHAIRKQNEMSEHHDEPVKQWRKEIEQYTPPGMLAGSSEESWDTNFQCVITDEELAMMDIGRLHITSPPPLLNSPPRPYSIIFDNLNFHIKIHHQTTSQHNKIYNWTHHMAVQDRVTPHHLPDNGATKPLPDIDLDEVLPTIHTQVHYRRELIALCSRTITFYCLAFKPFQDTVLRHLPHQYSKEMAEKSVEVPLGLLFKDENVTGDLVDILLHLQNEYVPKRGEKLCPLFAGGDRLSEGNSRNIQWAFQDGDTCEDRLEGLNLKYEDWHAIRNLHGIHMRIFFSEKSAKERGTMCSNMNVLKNTNAKKGPDKDYNAYKEFVEKDTDALLLAATMDHFNMESLEDTPSTFPAPDVIAQASLQERRQILTDLVGQVVDKLR